MVWQGRPTHPDDRLRSLAPEVLQPLFEVPGLEWVSLQKDATQHPDWLPERMAQCTDFADTAAVLQGLDLVVSIDSAVAHLAGALGKPVFVLLPPVADWPTVSVPVPSPKTALPVIASVLACVATLSTAPLKLTVPAVRPTPVLGASFRPMRTSLS